MAIVINGTGTIAGVSATGITTAPTNATDTTKLPLAGGTMTGDLILGDGIKLALGNKTGGDLAIYHDGSNSYVRDGGTGDLLLQGRNSVKLQDISGENYFVGTVDGSAELYHNNVKKIETTSAGATITGNIAVTGTVDGVDIQTLNTTASAALPKAGGNMSGVLTITKSGDGQTPFILNTGNNETLSFYNDSEQWMIKSAEALHLTSNASNAGGIYVDGSVDLYHNTSKKLETTASGIAVTGGIAIGGTGAANTLDDYEEGTFTMAIQDWSNATFSMGTIHVAKYTKVGNKVTIWFKGQFVSDSATPGGGDLKFTGWPFSTEGGKSIYVNPIFDHTTTNQTNAWLHFYGNGAYLYHLNSAGNPVDMTASLGGTTNMGLSFTYITA